MQLFRGRPERAWLIALVASAFIFTAAPQIDIAVSALFFSNGSFIGARSDALEAVRQMIWATACGVGIFAASGALIAMRRGSLFGSTYHIWSTVVAVYVLGPGIMANLILKSYWGRARPANIIEFGGSADFTPALMVTAECTRNCSFVSGEASGATALAVSIWLLSAPISTSRLRNWVRGLALAFAVVGSGLRVVAGRHFLSDAIFAAILVTGLAIVMTRYNRVALSLDGALER